MKKNTFKTICLIAGALILTGSMVVGTAWAYFTTYVTAKGGYVVELGFTKTEIEEAVEYGKKVVTLINTGDYDCYVRMKALTGNAYKDSLQYLEPDSAENWIPGSDGFYYYKGILKPEQETSELVVKFSFPNGKEPADFNVIIIQECTPVLFDESGNPYADWSVTADVSETIYKGEDES